MSEPDQNRTIQAGPGRRNFALVAEPAPGDDAPQDRALVRNLASLIYPGCDIGLMRLSQSDGAWRRLGRLAIGRVERAAGSEGDSPRAGSLIYWNGPLADFGLLDPERDVWAYIDAESERDPINPLLLPAGIGAEAQFGLAEALEILSGDSQSGGQSSGVAGGASFPEHVVVCGQGILGHLAGQWLRSRGASVAVVENSPKRLEFSKYSGLTQRIDTHNTNWMERLRRIVPDGTPLLVDACGSPRAMSSLLPILSDGGVLCRLGTFRPDADDSGRSEAWPDSMTEEIQRRGIRVTGPRPAFGEAPEHGDLLADWLRMIADGAISTERIMTDECTPEEAPLMLKRLVAGVKSICGVAVRWA